jgi:hypothetical protein
MFSSKCFSKVLFSIAFETPKNNGHPQKTSRLEGKLV